jgi:7-keto-8-aminopelargonate synthetase-like enzyme
MESLGKILAGRTVRGPISARIIIDDRPYINFFGAGYLALSNESEIRNAARQALDDGVPFARQLPAVHGACDPIFDAVERAGAVACGCEASIYFASGYLIGLVGIASLERPFDCILIDELAHHSLRDAAKASGKPTVAFHHRDSDSLGAALKQHVGAKGIPLVLTDGVFPTTGGVPPLRIYASLVGEYDGQLLIDESHAFGVVGENGRGAAEYCGVGHIAVGGATLSKAYCAQGAIIGCSAETAARLTVTSPIGGANSGSPLSAAAATASLAYVARRPEMRRQLQATAEHLRARLRGIGMEVIDSPAPIVSFQCGGRAEMWALQRRAFEHGIYIHHSTYIGAGPEGVIRCAVFRDHSREDIDALIAALT